MPCLNNDFTEYKLYGSVSVRSSSRLHLLRLFVFLVCTIAAATALHVICGGKSLTSYVEQFLNIDLDERLLNSYHWKSWSILGELARNQLVAHFISKKSEMRFSKFLMYAHNFWVSWFRDEQQLNVFLNGCFVLGFAVTFYKVKTDETRLTSIPLIPPMAIINECLQAHELFTL